MSTFDSDEVERVALAAARLGNEVRTFQSPIADGQGWWHRVEVGGETVGYVHKHQADHVRETIKKLKTATEPVRRTLVNTMVQAISDDVDGMILSSLRREQEDAT